MELLSYLGLFVVSLIVLLKASGYFVDSAEKIGLSFGISPFIIGVTIVAFGTSLPELATSVVSVLSGNSEIVGGTVIGSNITNILFVLGVTVIVGKKIIITHNVMDVDMPMLLISAIFCYFVLSDGNFTIVEAVFFLIATAIFLVNSLKGDSDDGSNRNKTNVKDYIILLVGGVLISLGATYTVVAIENLSRIGGVPKEVISLTVLALGTSLPEVVVSISAVRKGKQAIAVGNVLGSNIFNTYAVLGVARLFGPLEFSETVVSFSLPFMLAATFIFAVITLSKRINLWEGAMLLLLYGYYISTLVL